MAFKRRAVICLEDGNVFKSVTAAAKYYGCDRSEISKSCRGLRTTCVGRHFEWFDKRLTAQQRLETIAKHDADAIVKRRRVVVRKPLMLIGADGRDRLGRSARGPSSMSKSVICLDDNLVFPSIHAAAVAYDVNASAISELCRGRRFRQSVAGKHFAFMPDGE